MIRKFTIILIIIIMGSCNKSSEKKINKKGVSQNKVKTRTAKKTNSATIKTPKKIKKALISLKKPQLKCLAQVCYLNRINLKTKKIIESKKGYKNLKIVFNRGVDNSDFNTISLLPWVKFIELADSKVTNIKIISKLNNLEVLKIRNLVYPKGSDLKLDLSPIGSLKKLKILDLHYLKQKVSGTKLLKNLTSLYELVIWDTTPKEMGFITSLKSLKKLTIHLVNNFNPNLIFGLTDLEYLYLSKIKIDDFSALKDLVNLKRLSLVFLTGKVQNFSTLSNFTKLEFLSIQFVKISNPSFIRKFKSLKWLKIPGTSINNINFIRNLKHLLILDISHNPIKSIEPLRNQKELVQLNIKKTNVKNLNPLLRLKKLKNLSIDKKADKKNITKLHKKNNKIKFY